MTKVISPVHEYIVSRKKVLEYFKCEGDFYIKPLVEYYWSVNIEVDFGILSYWKDGFSKIESIIVRRNGEEIIKDVGGYTMIVGIDCVKVGFIFKNDNKKV